MARLRVSVAMPGSWTSRALHEPVAAVVHFYEVPTARVLKLEVDDGSDVVAGNFVKLTPRLRRSERGNFDAAAAVAELKARGAAAAVAAPIVIPDAIEPRENRPVAEHIDARAEVSAWFGDELDPDRAAALQTCLGILDQVGF